MEQLQHTTSAMNPVQNLYYALGELAYAMAKADGSIQNEEKKLFHEIVTQEIEQHNIDFDYSEIIFNIMEKDKTDVETSYTWAIKEIQNNKHYFLPELRKKFVSIMERVAGAFPPVTVQERVLLERFRSDINSIN
jgi:uncharacterized tellurite resistance protein B-like protein